MITKQWRTERTGWRDEELSKRHGLWGFNCPAVDLDFVMMEYNHGKPCALIEYKNVNAKPIDPTHATYRALVDLADNYGPGALPCFVAKYDNKDWWFEVQPLNEKARKYYEHCQGQRLSEQRFVKSLLLLRMKVLGKTDLETLATLNNVT